MCHEFSTLNLGAKFCFYNSHEARPLLLALVPSALRQQLVASSVGSETPKETIKDNFS